MRRIDHPGRLVDGREVRDLVAVSRASGEAAASFRSSIAGGSGIVPSSSLMSIGPPGALGLVDAEDAEGWASRVPGPPKDGGGGVRPVAGAAGVSEAAGRGISSGSSSTIFILLRTSLRPMRSSRVSVCR